MNTTVGSSRVVRVGLLLGMSALPHTYSKAVLLSTRRQRIVVEELAVMDVHSQVRRILMTLAQRKTQS